jgi:hypothetical protein
MSASEAAFLITSKSSSEPMTVWTPGRESLILAAFSSSRTRTLNCQSGWACRMAKSASPPMYPVAPVLEDINYLACGGKRAIGGASWLGTYRNTFLEDMAGLSYWSDMGCGRECFRLRKYLACEGRICRICRYHDFRVSTS